jgi:drug/metabolite transporter (DMT)-like permease
MTGAASHAADNPLRGIVLAASSCAVFAISDVTSKFLSTSMPIVEIQWIRYVLFFAMAAVLAARTRGKPLHPRNPKLQIVRALCVVASSVLFVYGIRQMTMAQATTIGFLSPLLITVLSIPLLGEVVGIRRWGAVLAGMIGMLIVVRPGTSGFQPAALFGVASSICWALGIIITRKIAASDQPQTTILWSSMIGAIVLTLLLPFDSVWPEPWQWKLCLMLGVLSSAGQWMVVLAHRLAPASLLAPISYTQLPWVTVGGYLVFANLPDRWTLVGASIIIASGLYTAHRERIRARTPVDSVTLVPLPRWQTSPGQKSMGDK